MEKQKKLLFSFTFFFFSFLSTSCFSGQAINNTDFTVLLAFKYSSDTSNSLSSWKNQNADSCSAWLGVVCHPVTHRVTKLVLDNLNLTGSTHLLSQLSELRHLSLHHNRLTRVPDFSAWPKLRHLYLSHNKFTGSFPAGVSALRSLRRLDLSYNYFSGDIPVAELSQLPHLLTLKLEFNGFNGSLGPVGSSLILTTLTDFNVAGNGLTGEIPAWLSRFPASSFAGNLHLCGKPLSLNCEISNATRGEIPLPIGVSETDINDKKKSSRKKQILMIATIDAVGAVLMILVVGLCCYYKKIYKNQERNNNKVKKINNTRDKLYYGVIRGSRNNNNDDGVIVQLEGCKGFNSVDDLFKASAEMLGKGSIGTTYKVVMDSGYVLMVKRIKERVKRGKEIDGVLRIIGGLRHPNVVSLRGYYSSKEELLLVSDFLPNGSLHNLLHGNRGPGRTPLDWPTRLKYALESAQGLAYIHNYSNSKLFHGHFTSSNIIIDQNNNACISDIGLHYLLQQVPLPSNNGYTAPEVLLLNTRKYTQKCDVYSFGVVLLEILTGKTVRNEDDESSLVYWAQRVGGYENWTWNEFDFELVRNRGMEEGMMGMLKVAMLCLATLPKDRPKMVAVCNMIEDIIRYNN